MYRVWMRIVARYQNTSNLEQHCITAGTDNWSHWGTRRSIDSNTEYGLLGSAADGSSIVWSRKCVAPSFTAEKKSSDFLRRDRVSLYFNSWKTSWSSQENDCGQETGKFIEGRNQYQIADLWWQRSLHQWWWHIQEMEVAYGGQDVGRTKRVQEVVVIWAESVAFVWFDWFASKRFVNVFTYHYHWLSSDCVKWLYYQIIDTGISALCMIIKGPDNQAQWSNQSIPKKKLDRYPWCS
jgi:hypothetical protein